MNIEEIKTAAAKLPPSDRFALAEWIEQSEDIRAMRHEALKQAVNLGLDEIDGGHCIECKSDAELKSFFDGVKVRGRKSLEAQAESAA